MKKVIEVLIWLGLLILAASSAPAQDVTLQGQLQGANGLPAANSTLELTPSQWFYIPNTNTSQPVQNIFGNATPTGSCAIEGQFFTVLPIPPYPVFECIYSVWVQIIGGSSGPVIEVNSTPISPASPANYVNTASVTWLFTGGQIEATGLASPLTTKGDIWGYDTTNDRIPVGADTYVLTADSTQLLGVKWAAPSSGTGCTTGSVAGWAQFSDGSGGCTSEYIDYGVTTPTPPTLTILPPASSLIQMFTSGTNGEMDFYQTGNGGVTIEDEPGAGNGGLSLIDNSPFGILLNQIGPGGITLLNGDDSSDIGITIQDSSLGGLILENERTVSPSDANAGTDIEATSGLLLQDIYTTSSPNSPYGIEIQETETTPPSSQGEISIDSENTNADAYIALAANNLYNYFANTFLVKQGSSTNVIDYGITNAGLNMAPPSLTGLSGSAPVCPNGTNNDLTQSGCNVAPALTSCSDESSTFTPASGLCYFVTASVSTATPAASAFVLFNATTTSAGTFALTGTTIYDGGGCSTYISGTTLTLTSSQSVTVKSDGSIIMASCTH